MVDLRLQTFITVASTNNLTKAAKDLNITQPAVSQHIKALETYYETKLLYKEGKHMKLTNEGELLLEYAMKISRLNNKLKRQIQNKSKQIKKYYVGATLTVGGYVLPQIISQYKRKYPNVEILLYVENTQAILKKLFKGQIDIGIIEGPFDKSKVQYKKYKDDELILVVSPYHPLAKRSSVTIEEVLKQKLILREKGSGTRKVFENAIIASHHELSEMNVYMEVGSLVAIISLIQSNLGCTIISQEAVRGQLEEGKLIEVPISNLKILREFNFVYLDDINHEFINNLANIKSIN
ncbi:LysR family transcriptional regulator [Clostridiaceae bacterium M8S5]|nr:LysR family transcriptional regulator [Clostridiaceae bacterium M8S5]